MAQGLRCQSGLHLDGQVELRRRHAVWDPSTLGIPGSLVYRAGFACSKPEGRIQPGVRAHRAGKSKGIH